MMDKQSAQTTDFREINTNDLNEKPFPGSIEDEFRVHFTKNAYKDMMGHARQTDEVELGGVLIGDVFQDSRGPFLSVIGSVPAEGANNYGAQITFTHDSWNHINKVKDEKYPDSKIVGWYHTHPGFGVFLSSMDSFIQENFFNQPFQIAVVIETKSGSEGCFAWIKGKPAALKRYWAGDKEIRLETGDATPFQDPENRSENAREPRRAYADAQTGYSAGGFGSRYIIAGLLLCLIGFAAGQWMALSKTSALARMVAESETAAAFEYAGLSTMMADDMRLLNSHLDASLSSLENKDVGKARDSLTAAKTWTLKKLEEYDARQSLRDRLRETLQYRGYLGMRMEELMRQQSIQGEYLAEIYLRDLIKSMDIIGSDQLDKMTPEYKKNLKLFVDRIIQLDPSRKNFLQKRYPALMDYLYPPGARKPQRDEAMKDDK